MTYFKFNTLHLFFIVKINVRLIRKYLIYYNYPLQSNNKNKESFITLKGLNSVAAIFCGQSKRLYIFCSIFFFKYINQGDISQLKIFHRD